MQKQRKTMTIKVSVNKQSYLRPITGGADGAKNEQKNNNRVILK